MSNQWTTLQRLVDWLDKENGTGETEVARRLLKVFEEGGEAVQAYIGMVGQNPRKGITHTRRDVADELFDVAVTALVAAHCFSDDVEQDFATKLDKIAARVGA